MARGLRAQARDVLELHRAGQHEEALARGLELARANPGSALALNLVGSLHRHSGSAAWDARASDDDEAASALELHHHHLALDAFSAAAQIAPDCVMTAIAHAEALAACGRLAEAPVELFRISSMAEADHTDPAVHHVGYDLVLGGSNAKTRKRDAVYKANVVMQDFEAMVNNEIVPIEAAKMLGEDVAVDQVRQRARLVSQSYPYSARAQLLCVYVELEHVRALDLPADRKRHLRRILALISDAAVTFDCSLLIALFHAKVLFVLDEFDESERECHRALCIDKPTDPNLDDIPPAVSVPGADYDSRVSYLQKQFRVFLKHIVVVAALYWPSIKRSQHHARIISVKVDTLQAHCNRIDPSAAKTISDAHRYLKKHNSWSFLICPNSRCDGRKFMDTESLCLHMRSKHRDGLWKKLESILGPVLNENASKDDHSLDALTLCQDSGQHDIFSLPRVQDMFECLLLSPSIGIQVEPLAEMRQRKRREGSEVLEDIKEKLKMLPEDVLSTEFEEFRFGIQNLWLKFLEISLLDYREVILPLARSFQWIEIKQWIARNLNGPNRSTGDANIDAVSDKIPVAPDHESGDNLQPEKLKTSCADETLTQTQLRSALSRTSPGPPPPTPPMEVSGEEFAVGVVISAKTTLGEEFEGQIISFDRPSNLLAIQDGVGRSERGERRNVRVLNADYIQEFSVVGKYDDPLDLAAIHAREEATLSEVRDVNSNSGATVDQSSSDPPADVDAEVELDKKGNSGQSVKEIASTSSYKKSLKLLNKKNADKDLSILSLIIRSLCNLRHLRDKLLTEPPIWIPSVENPCIAHKFYEIFSSWEKNDHDLTDVVLTYMKTLLCGIVDCTTFDEKAGIFFASESVATILIGLHMSETCSRFSLNKETEKHVVNPITCGDCICPTHNLFGIKFDVQMSCECGKCSGELLYTALFHKLDAGSPQTTKIKSFAELPVLLDEQFCKDNNCEDCETLLNIDLFLSNTPPLFTIVLNWSSTSESQDRLSEVLADITSPVDIGFFCKTADSSTMYTVTSMICCVDESYVCFARDNEDKWLIYDFETAEIEDTWEHLLERFKDCKLQPEVLFFEVIK
ncbi:unnamed protein product [Alopecurus aequalis]